MANDNRISTYCTCVCAVVIYLWRDARSEQLNKEMLVAVDVTCETSHRSHTTLCTTDITLPPTRHSRHCVVIRVAETRGNLHIQGIQEE